MAQYFLSPHSYVCQAGKHAVFLDLKKDQYSVVEPDDVASLRDNVQGWAELVETPDDVAAHSPTDESEAIQTLIIEGLLTTDEASGKTATPVTMETPTSTLVAPPMIWPHLTARHLRNYVSAWAITTLRLRTMSVSRLVLRARMRKQRGLASASPFDLATARRLFAIHRALQPAFYPIKDACLRNSLTLVEFMSRYQIYPTCVFGVKMDPFGAHAWVQHGTVVFTDPLEQIREYTPIMLI